jgi:hypothetical protein
MTRTTQAILKHVESLGYIVKIFHLNGTVEIHAVPRNGDDPQVARCNDGDGPDEEYCAACLIAEAVGIASEYG